MVGPVELYQQCLLMAPLPTKGLTTAGIWGAADLIQQLREPKADAKRGRIDAARSWSFFATGLGSGVIWACYYDVAEGIVQLAPGWLADSRLAYTAMSLALEQFVWCPIVFSAFQIPAAVFQNGGTVREVRV